MTAVRSYQTSPEPLCNMSDCNALDQEGHYYFNARWYDAETGRFITQDPARDGQNWYAYVSNNPLKFIDPTGMMGQAAALAAAEEGRDIEDSDSKYGHTLPTAEERQDKGDFDLESETKNLLMDENGNYDQNLYDALMNRFEKIPDPVLDKLIEMGIFDDDFTGAFYYGYGGSGYYLGSAAYDRGNAFEITNGVLTGVSPYESIGVGISPDAGANYYDVFGILPDGMIGDVFGLAGVASAGASVVTGYAVGIVTPNNNITGYEFFSNTGYSLLPSDINIGVSYTIKRKKH